MASLVESTPDVLTCSICLEIFTKPKFLPCLHTFCESCLLTYITSGFEKGIKQTIECPVCRGPVAVPKDNCTPEEWVKLIPLNFLISGMLENKKLSRLEKPCMLCERSNRKSVAKAVVICLQCADTLCETCAKYHSLMKFTSDHVIKPLDEYLSDDKKNLTVFKNTCSEHPNKIIELYCADHECPCCSICISIKHRRCEKVQTIDEAAEGILSSAMVQDIRQGLQDVCNDVDTVLKDRNDNLTQLEKEHEKELKTVDKTFQSLRDKLDEQQSLRKDLLQKTFNEKKDIIETEIVKFENNRKAIENERKLLEICVTEASNVQVMMEVHKFKTQLSKHKNTLRDNNDLQIITLSLKNPEYQSIINQIEKLCLVHCDITANTLSMKSQPISTIFKFNRFATLGSDTGAWVVKGNEPDAVSFLVSKQVLCSGFLTYGSKQMSNSCTIQATIKYGRDILREITTTLHDKKFENEVTEILLPRPVTLSPNEQYTIVFIFNSQSLCNYGEQGKSTLEHEDIVFSFKDSDISSNGTNVTQGQIPGILFRKACV
ncbi:probable E3 ubiquitin-protein ligase MID2 [Mytilus trossulus]|uniref:probable E3 ubiquitin-protein ligase MID2 n=1 Tax=Mytilus trossulus TaxID=6551 RepID=UPI003003AC38